MKTLTLELGTRSYPIHIGTGLLGQENLLAPCVGGSRVVIVTNETVAPLYLDRVAVSLARYQWCYRTASNTRISTC